VTEDRYYLTYLPWGEIKNGMRRRSHPLSEITGISKGNTTSHYAGFDFGLSARDDHLVRWADFATDELHFISNE
jgi:hypothetical protein